MGLLDRGRRKLESRLDLPSVLLPGEAVRLSGMANVNPGKGVLSYIGAMFGGRLSYFWVIVTERRLILVRLSGKGAVKGVERAVSLEEVRLVRHRGIRDFYTVALRIGEEPWALTFPFPYSRDGRLIGRALESHAR